MQNIQSMFDSIKQSVLESKNKNTGSNDYLKMEIEGTYNLRFLINPEDPKNTFYHYYFHGWNSIETGQYVSAFCPTTIGERCPICEARFKLYKTKKEEDKELASLIKRKEQHLANVYVIDSSSKQEDNDTVKIFRMAKTLYDKVVEAIDGEDADEYGPKIFDLSEKGCTFKIKVSSQKLGNKTIPNYEKASFKSPSAIPGMTKEKIEKVYEQIHDLTKNVTQLSTNELVDLLNTHVYGRATPENNTAQATEPPTRVSPPKLSQEELEELPFDNAPKKGATKGKEEKAEKQQNKVADDDDLSELLTSLESLED